VVPAAPAGIAVPTVTPPTPATPTETIGDDATPQAESIGDDATPMAAKVGSWSLVDLLCTILTTLLSIIMLIGALGRKRKEGDENESEYQAGNEDENENDTVYALFHQPPNVPQRSLPQK
jgi:hypothetical protein